MLKEPTSKARAKPRRNLLILTTSRRSSYPVQQVSPAIRSLVGVEIAFSQSQDVRSTCAPHPTACPDRVARSYPACMRPILDGTSSVTAPCSSTITTNSPGSGRPHFLLPSSLRPASRRPAQKPTQGTTQVTRVRTLSNPAPRSATNCPNTTSPAQRQKIPALSTMLTTTLPRFRQHAFRLLGNHPSAHLNATSCSSKLPNPLLTHS